ncbi:hypothetical protein [Streptomyces pseudovenezuelae]|uniref:hypothetical protein n=1 Tax=Streptomyces pseudovenezuelae TaxID=67350 RepID=UPI0038B68D6E
MTQPGRRRWPHVDDREDNCWAAAELGLRDLHYTGQPADLEHQLLPALANSTRT